MADIVREAVVKLGIEQSPVDLQAPDMTGLMDALDQATKQARELGDTAKQANEAAADAAAKAAEEAARKQAEAAAKAAKAKEDAARRAAEADKRAAEEGARAVDAANARVKESIENLQGSFSLAVGGVTGLAGAYGALKASQAENLDPAIRLGLQFVAASQAAKAAIETYQGVAGILSALRAAQQAQAAAATAATAANAANATAVAASGAAAATATPAMIAFAAAAAPILVAVGSVVAIIATLSAVYRQLADDAEDAAQREIAARQAAAQATRDWAQSVRDDIRSLSQESERLPGVMDDMQLAARMERQRRIRDSSLDDARNTRYSGANMEGMAEADQRSALRAAIEAAKIQQDRVRLAEQEAQSAQQVNEAQIKAVENQERAVNRAREALQIEQDRVRSLRAQVGQLDAAEQVELRRLANKVKEGRELTGAELQRFGQLGGGLTRGFVEQQFAGRGAGLAEFVGSVTGVDASDTQANQLQSNFERLTAELSKLTDGEGAAVKLAELRAEAKEATAVAEAYLGEMKSLFEENIQDLRTVRQALDDINNANR